VVGVVEDLPWVMHIALMRLEAEDSMLLIEVRQMWFRAGCGRGGCPGLC
jgi:hypothetical protein